MADEPSAPPQPTSRFRSTLIRVMSMQVFTLILLGLLQLMYTN